MYGVGPRNDVLGGMAFYGALREVVGMKGMLCQCRGHGVGWLQMWMDGIAGTRRKLWGWRGFGKQEIRLLQHGKDIGVIYGVETICTVEWQKRFVGFSP